MDDIQTALKRKKKMEKFKYIHIDISRLVKSFKTMNRPYPTRPGTTGTLFDDLFIVKSYRWNFDTILMQVFNLC